MKRVAVAAFVWVILTMVLITVATALLWTFNVFGYSFVSCTLLGGVLGVASWHIAGELLQRKDRDQL